MLYSNTDYTNRTDFNLSRRKGGNGRKINCLADCTGIVLHAYWDVRNSFRNSSAVMWRISNSLDGRGQVLGIKVPHFLVRGVEDMGIVLMHVNPFDVLAIDIAT